MTGGENASEAARLLGMNRAHFAAWAITSSPLIVGFAFPPPPAILELVTNRRAIEVNQEFAGNAGDLVRAIGDLELWAKPLPAGGVASLVLNRANGTARAAQGVHPPQEGEAAVAARAGLSYRLDELPGVPTGTTHCIATDVWSGEAKEVGPEVQASPGAQSGVFLVFTTCA